MHRRTPGGCKPRLRVIRSMFTRSSPRRTRGDSAELRDTRPYRPSDATIRAYLYARPQGGWDGAFPDWFDQANAPVVNRGQNDPEPPVQTGPTPGPAPAAPAATNGSILQKLGLRAEQVQVSGRLVLKVIDVVPDSPAGQAGLEQGDVLVGVNGGFITDIDQLTTTILKGAPTATFAVLNVRDGKTANVKVNLGGLVAAESPQPKPEAAPAPTRTLGVKTEQVRAGNRTAIRVTEVQEDSPAAKAGLEAGDVITEASGTATTDLAQLNAAVQNSGPVLALKVFDPRTRREVPVQVHFDAQPAVVPGTNPPQVNIPQPQPQPQPQPGGRGGTSARAIGLSIEAGTADLLPVVKVVQVQPGSPAEKAGIEPGDAIVGLNDKVIFAPDLLDEALKSAGNTFTLNVMDRKTGKKTPVKVTVP